MLSMKTLSSALMVLGNWENKREWCGFKIFQSHQPTEHLIWNDAIVIYTLYPAVLIFHYSCWFYIFLGGGVGYMPVWYKQNVSIKYSKMYDLILVYIYTQNDSVWKMV